MCEEKIKLEWGQTPWDDLSKEELLKEVQKMFSALMSAMSVLKMNMIGYENSPFWSNRKGTGARAIEKARQVIDPIYGKFDRESIYRSFYRTANDLLFDNSKFDLGFGWSVCPICGLMIGADIDGKRHDGEICQEVMLTRSGCNGILRPLIWDDLRPIDKNETTPKNLPVSDVKSQQ